jgi:hypothetical protein
VVKFTSSTTIGNSQIVDDGTNVGININPPTAPLHLYKGTNAFMNIQSGGGEFAYLRLSTPSSGEGYIIKNLTTGNSALNKSLYLYNSDGPIQFVPNGLIANAMAINITGAITVNSTSTTSGIFNSTGTASGIQLTNSSGTASSWIVQSDGGVVAGQAALRFYSATAGVYRMSIDGNGNVGIGISSPTNYSGFNTLHINGKSGSTGGVLRLTAFDDSSTLNIYTQSGGAFFNATTAGLPFVFLTNDTPRFRINGDGNVGIGVDPSSWASGTEGALQIKNGGVYGYSDYEVGLTANAYYNSGWKRIGANTASMVYVSTDIQFRIAPSSTAGSSITWTTPIWIVSTGEVSFTSIARSWSYSSPSTDYKNIDWGGGGILYRDTSDSYYSSNCYYSTSGWKAKYSNSGGVGIIRFIAGNFAWQTYDGAVTAGSVYTLTDKFYISKSGNVGIGRDVTEFPNGDALLIKDDGVWNVTIGLQNTGTGGRKWNIFSTNTTFSQGAGKLLIYNATAGSDAMVINASNQVGLGTTDPTNTLHLAGSSATPSLRLGSTSTGFHYDIGRENATTGDFLINATVSGVLQGSYLRLASSGGAATFISSVTATSGFEIPNGQFYRARRTSGNLLTDMIGIPSGTDNVRVLTTGNFDIINGSLTTLLSISNSGDANFNGGAVRADGGYFAVRLSGGASASGYLLREASWLGSGSSANLALAAEGGNSLIFYTDGQTTRRMIITTGGQVGINTTNTGGLTGSVLYIRSSSTNVGQSAISIQDYLERNRWAINGQDGANEFSLNIYSAPTATNDFTRRLRIGQDGTFSFNGTITNYTYNFEGGSIYIPGGQGANSTAAYTAFNQLVFGDQFSDVARGPNKIVTYGRGGGWVGGIGIHSDTQAYYAGGTHKWYKFDGSTVTLNLSLDGSGNLTATGGFFEGSDMRLKELIQDDYLVTDIETIQPKLYIKNGKKEVGYYAQEFETLFPQVINVDENGYLSLSYREVHTLKIAYLEQKIKQLEKHIQNENNRINNRMV